MSLQASGTPCRLHGRAESASLQVREVSAEVAARRGVEIVDPVAWMCADGLCPAVVGSTIAYRDPGHITVTRSMELAEPLGRALGLWKG